MNRPVYINDSVIEVTVGRNRKKQTFRVAEGPLTYYSTYFQGALRPGHFKEGEERKIHLTHDDPDVFQLFFYWLFTHQLWDKSLGPGSVPLDWDLLCRIYVFGDARGIPALRNTAIDALMDKIGVEWEVLLSTQSHYIYKNTLEGSLLRKLAVDQVVKTRNVKVLLAVPCHWEFSTEVAVELQHVTGNRKTIGQDDWKLINKCEYHDHTEVTSMRG